MKKFKEKLKQKLKALKNKMAFYTANASESGNLSVIFLLSMIGNALNGVGHFILFPTAMLTSALGSMLSIRHAYLTGRKDPSAITDAAANVITSLGVIGALILAFIGQGAVAVVAHGLLTGVVGFKACYDLAAAGICWYKYFKHKDKNPKKAMKYREQAKEYFVGFLVEALFTGAFVGVFLLHKPTCGLLGVLAGAGCVYYSSKQAYKQYKEKVKQELLAKIKEMPDVLPSEKLELTNNALIYSFMDALSAKEQETMPVVKENTMLVSENSKLQVNDQEISTNINQHYSVKMK